MARSSKNPIFSRKIEELEQESERLQDHIKMLSKSLRKFEATGELPLAAPAPKAGPRVASTALSPAVAKAQEAFDRIHSASRNQTVAEAVEQPAPAQVQADGELFPGFKSQSAEKRRPVPDAEKFASYFASGSFGKASPLPHEKKLQRNKAIFMLIFALLAAFIVLRMAF